MSTIKVTPQDLRALATKCHNEAKSVTEVKTKVSSAIGSTDWDSPAATKFKGDWNHKYVKALNELTAALDDLGKAAETMAKNYDATESAYHSN